MDFKRKRKNKRVVKNIGDFIIKKYKGECVFYKVQDVKSLEKYKLLVYFTNGEREIYDIKPLFDKNRSF